MTYKLCLLLQLFFIFIYLPTGISTARIRRLVGAEDATLDDIYYQASLKFEGYHVCGGSIITPQHILTAAHCVADLFDPPFDELQVYTGAENLKIGGNKHKVLNVSWHPEFKNGKEFVWANDVAVLTLKNEIDISSKERPVNLPEFPTPINVTGTISGWGRVEANGNPYSARTLKKADVKILDHEQCQQYHNYTINDGQICGQAHDRNVGICNGDSGGPLVVNNTVVGISSWTISIPSLNIPCGTGVPDVYTDVYHFLKYIQSVIHGH